MQVGDLSVRIGADTGNLTKGLDGAKSSLKGFESSALSVTGVLKGLFAAFSVQQFTQFIRGTINAADEMGKLSQKLGIGTEELSKLQYAAELAGVSTGELQSSLARLTKGMSDAANGTGEALRGFQALGIQVQTADGSLRSSSDIMGDVADAFSKMQDGANKTALAISIFGRSGANLIPLLNGGRDAIKQAGDELERFGGVVTPDAARKAEIFNDNLTRMQTVVKGVGISIANDLLPFLTRLSEEFLVAEKNSLSFFDKLQLGLRSPFKNYQQLISDIDRELADLGDSTSLRFDAERAASLQRQRAYYAEMAQIQALASANEEYTDFISRRLMPKPEERGAGPSLVDPKLAEAERKELEDRLKAIRESLMSESQLAQEKYDRDLKTLEEARAKGVNIEGGYDKAIQDLRLQHQQKLREIEANSPEALAEQKAAERLIALENSLTAERDLLIADYEMKRQMLWDKYMVDGEVMAEGQAYLAELTRQHEEKLTALTDAETRKRVQLEQSAQNAIYAARAGVAQASIGLLNAFAGKSKAAALAAVALNKALAIAQIIQNTAAAQMRAMAELGPIAGPPVAANIGMMGKIQAGIVAATGLFEAAGAAGGGGGANISSSGPTSGGVNTGIGSAAPAGAAFGGGQVVNISLTGEVFGREQVRGLIGQINEAISDGAVLRVQ